MSSSGSAGTRMCTTSLALKNRARGRGGCWEGVTVQLSVGTRFLFREWCSPPFTLVCAVMSTILVAEWLSGYPTVFVDNPPARIPEPEGWVLVVEGLSLVQAGAITSLDCCNCRGFMHAPCLIFPTWLGAISQSTPSRYLGRSCSWLEGISTICCSFSVHIIEK